MGYFDIVAKHPVLRDDTKRWPKSKVRQQILVRQVQIKSLSCLFPRMLRVPRSQILDPRARHLQAGTLLILQLRGAPRIVGAGDTLIRVNGGDHLDWLLVGSMGGPLLLLLWSRVLLVFLDLDLERRGDEDWLRGHLRHRWGEVMDLRLLVLLVVNHRGLLINRRRVVGLVLWLLLMLGLLAVVHLLNHGASDADAGVAAGRTLDGMLLRLSALVSLHLRIRNVHGGNPGVVLLCHVVWVATGLEWHGGCSWDLVVGRNLLHWRRVVLGSRDRVPVGVLGRDGIRTHMLLLRVEFRV